MSWLERGLREMRDRSRIIAWPGSVRRWASGQGRLRVVPDLDADEEETGARPERGSERPISTLRLTPYPNRIREDPDSE